MVFKAMGLDRVQNPWYTSSKGPAAEGKPTQDTEKEQPMSEEEADKKQWWKGDPSRRCFEKEMVGKI